MAGITEIFTPSFAFSLAICLLLTGLIAVYFTQKVAEQNHKMTSMLELVSTLANEVNMMRGHIFSQQQVGGGVSDPVQTRTVDSSHLEPSNIKLISVSDDSDSDSDSDNDNDSDNDGDSDSDNDSDDSPQDDEKEDDEDDNEDDDNDAEEDNDDSQSVDVIELTGESSFPETFSLHKLGADKSEDINILNFEELCIVEEVEAEAEAEPTTLESKEGVKNIDIVLDYKKASLGKLKSLVVERGLLDEKAAAKLKKPDLLKLLE
jgi:cobalamin biosynthesis protein CobT